MGPDGILDHFQNKLFELKLRFLRLSLETLFGHICKFTFWNFEAGTQHEFYQEQ